MIDFITCIHNSEERPNRDCVYFSLYSYVKFDSHVAHPNPMDLDFNKQLSGQLGFKKQIFLYIFFYKNSPKPDCGPNPTPEIMILTN